MGSNELLKAKGILFPQDALFIYVCRCDAINTHPDTVRTECSECRLCAGITRLQGDHFIAVGWRIIVRRIPDKRRGAYFLDVLLELFLVQCDAVPVINAAPSSPFSTDDATMR